MRVTMKTGAKRVTLLGPARIGHVVVRERREYGAADKLKFTVIKPSGQIEHGELRLDLGPVKRSTRSLRPLERGLRKMARAQYKAAQKYLVLHDRSRRRSRNGWIVDLGTNVVKSIRR